jgi:hypothetical protein
MAISPQLDNLVLRVEAIAAVTANMTRASTDYQHCHVHAGKGEDKVRILQRMPLSAVSRLAKWSRTHGTLSLRLRYTHVVDFIGPCLRSGGQLLHSARYHTALCRVA